MKTRLFISKCCLAAALTFGGLTQTKADVTYTVDPGATWLGYMNVFELPSNGGAFVFGSGWGIGDLRASFAGDVLTLSPNTIGDPAEFWYIGGGGPGASGNKIMDANLYQEFNGSLAGQTVTFTGNVLANSLTESHTAVAFIKDFAPDYSSFESTIIALTPGVFSISLETINDPTRHVQFGFTVNGVNVWETDVEPFGSVQITAVPKPSVIALAAIGLAGIACRRRCRA